MKQQLVESEAENVKFAKIVKDLNEQSSKENIEVQKLKDEMGKGESDEVKGMIEEYEVRM